MRAAVSKMAVPWSGSSVWDRRSSPISATGAAASGAGTAARAHFYKWLAWLTNTMQATLMIYFYPERWVPAGDVAGAANLKANAQARVVAMFDQLQAQLQSHGGPWLLGADYSALDPYAMMLCRWTRGFERPARSLPLLKAWLDRVLERPAVQRVLATEGLPPPWV